MSKKYLDYDGLDEVVTQTKAKFVQKAFKTGSSSVYKVLSDNNFSDDQVSKLSGIESGSQANTIETIKVNNTALTPDANKAVNIDLGSYALKSGAVGSFSLSLNSSTYVISLQAKDVDGNNLGSAQTVDLPLESVVVSGSYNSSTKKVVLTLKDGSTIDFSVADLISGLQAEITSSNKLSADLIEDGTTNKTFTAAEKTKLSGIDSGAEVNVQADWNEQDSSSDAFIKNKPTIPTDTNQKIKTSSVTFGNDDVVQITAGSNIQVSGDASNKTITISSTPGVQEISTQSVEIYNLSSGVYKLTYAGNKLIKYNPANTEHAFTIKYKNSASVPILIVGMSADTTTSNPQQFSWMILADKLYVGENNNMNPTTGYVQSYYLSQEFLQTDDVVNNLTSTSTNKPLSASQGKTLKDEIDTLPDTAITTSEIDALFS